MPERTLHLSSILQAFSTFLALRDVSDKDAEAAVIALMSLLERKKDLSSWRLEEISHAFAKMGAAELLVMQFVEHFPPFQASTILHKYLFALKEHGCSSATIRNYRSDISQFLSFHASQELDKLMTKPKVLEFLAGEETKQLKLASIRRKLISLTQFALWLESQDTKIHAAQELSALQSTLENDLKKPTSYKRNNPPTPDKRSKHWNLPLKEHPSAPTQKRPVRAHQDYRARLESHWRNIRETVTTKTKLSFLPYLNLAMILLFVLGGGYFGYVQFFRDAPAPLAFPNTPVRPSRTLSFQGRLTDTAQNPVVTASDFAFRLYDSGPGAGGSLLWDSGTCSVDPDQDGIFATGLGDPVNGCGAEIAASVFSENSNIWLEVEVESETLTPRQQIRTVAYALNSETVQGIPVSATEAATANTLVVLNEGGEVVLGEVSPKIRSTSGTFTIDAQSLLLKTSSGSNGDINLSPDGTGKTIVNSRLDVTNYVAAPGATLSATYAGGTALVAKGGPSGTANIQEWQNAAGAALSVVSASGNLGVGTTNPTAGMLHVVGQCVTGDTKLRRKRKKKRTGHKLSKNDPPCIKCGRAATCDTCEYFESVRIDQIQPKDEILTLEETTGKFITSKVRGLMDMGEQEVFELLTSHGKKIKTTANHPYLVLSKQSNEHELIARFIHTKALQIDQSIRIEEIGKDSYLAIANEEVAFTVKLPSKAKRVLSQLHALKRSSKFGFQIFAQLIIVTLTASRFKTNKLIIDNEYPGYENEIKAILRQKFPDISIEIRSIGKKSPAHYSAYGGYMRKQVNYVIDVGEILLATKSQKEKTEDYNESKETVTPKDKSLAIRSSLGQWNKVYQSTDVRSSEWKKVADLKTGMQIATVDGFEHIISIRSVGKKQTYDIEVENTHNFVGNGIVAHNTYISGNVGIGTTGPTSLLHLAAGSATRAPLKLTTGTNLTTAQTGAFEYDGAELYFTPVGTTRETVAYVSDITAASHDALTIGNIGASPNAKGMTLTGQLLNLEPASDLFGGVVTTGAQTLAGAKTLTGLLTTVGISNSTTAITNSAAYTQSGTSANTFTGASSFTAAGSALTVTNNAVLGSTDIGGGYGSTGATIASTGNIQTNGALTVDLTSTLTGMTTMTAGFDSNAASTVAGLTVDGNGNLAVSNGTLSVTAPTTTGVAATVIANSLTTGTGLDVSSTSTAGGASGVSKLLNLSRSGANAQLAHTAYGLYSAVTNTNATSGTNIAGYFSASGATTANYGLIVAAGNVGIGNTAPGAALDVLGNVLIQGGGTIDTRAAGTLTIGGTTQTGLILGRTGQYTRVANLTTNGVVYTGGGIGTLNSEAQLAITRGGTNSTAVPTAGAVAYGTGSAYAFNTAGTSGMALVSGGTGAPTFGTLGLTYGGTNASLTADAGGIVYSTASALAILPDGSSGTCLKSGGTGAPTWGACSTGSVTGSGTLNYLPKWTPDGATLGNSVIYDNGTNVGIGTTAPYGKLVVQMPRTSSAVTVDEVSDYLGTFVLATDGASNNGDKMPLVFNLGTAGTHSISSVIEAGREASGWNTYLSFYTNNVTSGPQGVDAIQEKMRITSAGNVGIGTTAPGSVLSFGGTDPSITTDTLDAADNKRIQLSGGGGTPTSNRGALLQLAGNEYAGYTGGSAYLDTGGVNNAFIRFRTAPSGVQTDTLMLINGNVGIGTTAPVNLLHLSKYAAGDKTNLMVTSGTGFNATAIGDAVSIGMSTYNAGAYPVRLKTTATQAAPSFPNPSFEIITNTSGTENTRLFIKNDGNVGIGTTAPGSLLTVSKGTISTIEGGAALDSTVLIRQNTNSTGASALEFGFGTTPNYLGSRIVSDVVSGGGADLYFQTGTGSSGTYTTKMIIKRDGNVGIGTTGPANPLEVRSDSFPQLRISYKTLASRSLDIGHNAVFNLIDTSDTNDYRFQKAGTDLMTIKQNGNVGIGTTAPGAKLDVITGAVSGSGFHLGEVNNEGLYLLSTIDSQGVLSAGSELSAGLWYARATTASMVDQSTGVIKFTTDSGLTDGNTFTPSVRMTILSNGNVGINTTAPSTFKLQVAGHTGPDAHNTYDLGTTAVRWRNVYAGTYYGDGSGLTGIGTAGGWTDDGTVVRLTTSTDNVGIGTTNPIGKLEVVGGYGTSKIFKEVSTGQPDYTHYYLKLFKKPSGLGGSATTFNGKVCVHRTNELGVSQCADIYASRGYDSTIYFSEKIDAVGGYGAFQLVTVNEGGFDWVALYYNASGGAGIYSWTIDGTISNQNGDVLSFAETHSTSVLHSALTYTARNTSIPYGNVGIGTTAPTAPLTVAQYAGGGITTQGNLGTTGNTINLISGYAWGVTDTTYGSGIKTIVESAGLNTYGLGIWTRSAYNGTYEERVRVSGNGNVGIGTTGPTNQLSIYRSDSAITPQLSLRQGSTGDAVMGFYRAASVKLWNVGMDGSDSDKLKFSTDVGGDVGVSTVLTLQQNGNVGIGTTGPGSTLEVAGNTAEIYLNPSTFNNGGFYLKNASGTKSFALGVTGAAGVNNSTILQSVGGGIAFRDSSANVKMYMNEGGNVGIGTTAPGEKLHVVGTSLFTSTITSQGVITGAGSLTLRGDTTSPSGGHIFLNDSGSSNVGIGTTAPREKLEINGNITTDWTDTARIGMQYLTGSDYRNGMSFVSSTRTTQVDALSGDSSSRITFRTGTVASPSEKMRIQYDGNVGIGTTGPGYKLDVNGDANVGTRLNIAGNSVLYLPSNNPERGPWNPIWNAVGSGKPLYFDEEFASGNNSVSVYNNSGGSAVTITRQTGQVGVPNSTGVWLKVSYDGIGPTSPNFGGILLQINPAANKTFVQRIRAKIPVGKTLNINENSQGTNSTSYWLTDDVGTGKWEDYIRVSHAGNTGTFSSGGHISISGGSGAFDWYIASINVYEVNVPQYASANTWLAAQTFSGGANFPGSGIWNTSGNVGIGTTAPGSKLYVSDPSGTFSIAARGNNADGVTVIGTDSTGLPMIAGYNAALTTSKNLSIQPYGGDVLFPGSGVWKATSGNVGIGTTATGALLHTSKTGSSDQETARFSAPSGNPYITIGNGVGATTGGYVAWDDTNDRLRFGIHGSETMTIKAGNVGIGTTTPTEKLHVYTGVTGGITVDGPDATQQALRISKAGIQKWYMYVPASSNDLRFFDASGDRVTFQSGGNVGIGTTNPTYKLHVAGNCVVGNTMLSIRRRKKKKGAPEDEDDLWEYLLCRIDEILPGDEVLSLNEATGDLEYARINQLMDMGIKQVYELTTKSGRKITTTAEHPFLTRQ